MFTGHSFVYYVYLNDTTNGIYEIIIFVTGVKDLNIHYEHACASFCSKDKRINFEKFKFTTYIV